MQVMPLAITTPPDFDLGAFTESVLRIGGLDADQPREPSPRRWRPRRSRWSRSRPTKK